MRYTFQYAVTTTTTVKRVLARAGVSHRLMAKAFAAGLVQINGTKTTNRPAHPGDMVQFVVPSEQPVAPSAGSLAIVVETANWLIVDKPTGVASVPGPSSRGDSLLNRAAGYLLKRGVQAPQPAIITRLDRDTMGLVLIAKHPFAQSKLDQLGVDEVVTKTYRALIAGTLEPAQGTINAPVGKAADGIHREVRSDGQTAETTYHVIEQANGLSLVELQLLTGRTHQIRVHLASLGHPIVGDALYGGDLLGARSQMLQAGALTFTDPFTAKQIKASLPLPASMAALLAPKNPTAG